MKKLITLLALAVMVGCASFSTNVFRTEQTLTGVAYTAYVGYTNGLYNGTLHVDPTNQAKIKQARLEFAASVRTVEAWRVAYETNSAVKPQAQAALDALTSNTTNFVNLIHLFQTP